MTMYRANGKAVATLLAAVFLLAVLCGVAAAVPPRTAPNEELALRLEAKLEVLPLAEHAAQEIVVFIETPDARQDEHYDLYIAAESGFGVFVTHPAPGPSGVIRYKLGERLHIPYRWSGLSPAEAPFPERITARIPSLGLEAEVSFDIGMDLRIESVVVPTAAEVGQFAPIRIDMCDAFHPELRGEALADLLRRAEVTPEVRIDLIPGTPTDTVRLPDPIVARFFDRVGPQAFDLSVPGTAYRLGTVSSLADGPAVWRSADGEETGVKMPRKGNWRVLATLKSNAGGYAVKNFLSDYFEVSGVQHIGGDMPHLAAQTTEILYAIDSRKALRAHEEARRYVADGRARELPTHFGVYAFNVAEPTKLSMLGRYVHALTASTSTIDEMVPWIRAFLEGYGDYGVLIVAKGGLSAWRATGRDGEAILRAPQGPVFENAKYLVIPFRIGADFDLEMRGGGGARTLVWNVIPAGATRAAYPSGTWSRRLHVRAGAIDGFTKNKIYH